MAGYKRHRIRTFSQQLWIPSAVHPARWEGDWIELRSGPLTGWERTLCGELLETPVAAQLERSRFARWL